MIKKKKEAFLKMVNNSSFSFKAVAIIILTLAITVIGLLSFDSYSKTHIKDRIKEPVYFGASYMTMNNPFFEIINDEIKSVVEANGDILITLDPALSLDEQIKQINYMLDKGIEVLFVNPIDWEGLSDVLKRCKEENVKVVVVDTNIKDDELVSYTVVSDNYNAGVQAAEDMMSQLDEANILLLEHSNVQSAIQRIQGFTDTIDPEHYHIVYRKNCEGQLENATPIVNEAIEEGIKFDVVMALNDPSAMGAMAALQEHDLLDGILVYGVDGTPETKALIRDNKMRGTVAQSPIRMGRRAAEIGYQLLNDDIPQKTELIDVELITKETIHNYTIEGWQ
ncbi:ribose transport system substrate-binding protein [Breznakia sp. PF5-3]|uniref:sugar ABC transporter substrate-binding protein n=1 Tax=unclassified Breznakia TaxID=2623764 RepID=UPI0024067C37|nr:MULTISPECIES: sugar ABC transporter substrate-binding protein [unclassified Breznakia]MDF9824862.1 ribose transport system substrate-binding protein [Breznakia sp. PM6-1]MDF9835719.1 ribose transport system substrate-binding protein [Breznakia sp. PF5-3]MDF9838279.1 ribose transport system substrate-binding protein [Breznakia sp. PFB2-8]MDF9860282.1 ribose transport system substrate-binding protein [Breznakia sp. PH5-24]